MSVDETIAALDRGELRVAEKRDGEWQVNEEAKSAILEYFRVRKLEPIDVGPFEYLDKIPLKRDHAERGVRVVPPATARYGAAGGRSQTPRLHPLPRGDYGDAQPARARGGVRTRTAGR